MTIEAIAGLCTFAAIFYVAVLLVAKLQLPRVLSPALSEIHSICRRLENREISALTACHEISKLIPFLTGEDIFLANGKLFTELDTNVCSKFPIGDSRLNWSQQAIQSVVTELEEAEAKHGAVIKRECQRILYKRSVFEFWK